MLASTARSRYPANIANADGWKVRCPSGNVREREEGKRQSASSSRVLGPDKHPAGHPRALEDGEAREGRHQPRPRDRPGQGDPVCANDRSGHTEEVDGARFARSAT
jgi:hypothetical protein